MKKIISVLMCLFIVFGISGCGSSTKEITGNKEIISKLEKEKFKFKIELMDTIILTKGDVRFECGYEASSSKLGSIQYYPNYGEDDFESETEYEPYKSKNKKIAKYLSKYGISTKNFSKAIASYYKSHFKEATKNKKFSWPSNVITATLPTPSSTNGMITDDSSDFFTYVLFDVSESEYNDYINEVISKGYNVDYNKSEDYFSASNNSNCTIDIEYYKDLKYVTGTVDYEKPKDTTTSTDNNSNTDTSTVTPSFKESMDSYETFFNSYADFMKKYKDNPSDADLISDYTDMLTKYSDTMTKMSAIDTSTLSAADLAYYNTVNARITTKLASVS
ncbi:MAG: hypothetical protein PHH04_03220 [Thomasclavelia sp.]|nr:hypothetical protein [Thomasclavelia sp.]